MALWAREIMVLANDFCLNTEKEKKDIVALFISEYQKGKEEKNERED